MNVRPVFFYLFLGLLSGLTGFFIHYAYSATTNTTTLDCDLFPGGICPDGTNGTQTQVPGEPMPPCPDGKPRTCWQCSKEDVTTCFQGYCSGSKDICIFGDNSCSVLDNCRRR